MRETEQFCNRACWSQITGALPSRRCALSPPQTSARLFPRRNKQYSLSFVILSEAKNLSFQPAGEILRADGAGPQNDTECVKPLLLAGGGGGVGGVGVDVGGAGVHHRNIFLIAVHAF